jgi:hypothetical protein
VETPNPLKGEGTREDESLITLTQGPLQKGEGLKEEETILKETG